MFQHYALSSYAFTCVLQSQRPGAGGKGQGQGPAGSDRAPPPVSGWRSKRPSNPACSTPDARAGLRDFKDTVFTFLLINHFEILREIYGFRRFVFWFLRIGAP